jgi:hypothetical protein
VKKNELTQAAMLAEAVGIVAGLVYVGLQIYYGIAYHANLITVFMNVAVLLLVYAGLTMLSVYPERVNGLSPEQCSGKIRTYTIRMVRVCKLIFVGGLCFTSVCDVLGKQINSGYSLIVVVLMVAVALFYEYRIIKILRDRKEK